MLRVFLSFLTLVFALPLAAAVPDAPDPQTVAVIYNSELPESKKLAELYAKGRSIPLQNLVGLKLPDKEQISRLDFDSLIRLPLIAEFDRRKWWERRTDPNGYLTLASTRIQILACMRGVPSRIKHPKPKPKLEPGEKPKPHSPKDWLKSSDASVDSELVLLGIEGQNLEGPLNNPYFDKDRTIRTAGIPLLLVGRIDGPSFATCERMIRDALATEKTGLWGMALVDIANKIKQGDQWLENVATSLANAGIPTQVDRFNPTLPLNYPINNTAIYFGWYDGTVSGPFKNPNFQFKQGAVAVHLHSFSAAQLRNPKGNWCAPILDKGAAATLGNVYEPLLHLTHHFDIFTDRLLKGYSLVEAAYMSYPALSWQGVVLGDPLYRPFIHLDGSGIKKPADAPYRALRIAELRWASNPLEREQQLRAAAARMKSAVMLEAIGHNLSRRKQANLAAKTYLQARNVYTKSIDKFRMDMLVAALQRQGKSTPAAIETLRQAKLRYPDLPELTAATAWLNILDPPPPPPSVPKKDKP